MFYVSRIVGLLPRNTALPHGPAGSLSRFLGLVVELHLRVAGGCAAFDGRVIGRAGAPHIELMRTRREEIRLAAGGEVARQRDARDNDDARCRRTDNACGFHANTELTHPRNGRRTSRRAFSQPPLYTKTFPLSCIRRRQLIQYLL